MSIIARFEAEPIRKAGEFIIKNWWWEPEVEPNDEMREMIVNEMARFTEFLQIDNSPKNYPAPSGRYLSDNLFRSSILLVRGNRTVSDCLQ